MTGEQLISLEERCKNRYARGVKPIYEREVCTAKPEHVQRYSLVHPSNHVTPLVPTEFLFEPKVYKSVDYFDEIFIPYKRR